MEKRMLSKDDEQTPGGDDVEVRREDQEQINRFSRLNNRESILEDELKQKQKDKEDLEELVSELELADEDEKIPYKIGDSFFSLPISEVQDLLSKNVNGLDDDVSNLEEKLSSIREEMEELKVALYGRFGKTINLER